MQLTIGLASGLGNCVYMLPTVKALRLLGHNISLYVQTDFPTAALWRRCLYADLVLEPPAAVDGERVCGQWRPTGWRELPDVKQYRLSRIHECEWRSNLKLAQAFGWKGDIPDVSDWCRDLDRTLRWDVGIVPGCKGGTWLRKRWPGLRDIAAGLLARGRSVAVFGLPDDGIAEIPGEQIDTSDIVTLPDALAGCKVVIGGDSGVVHLASSLGIPVVMVYTATSEIKAEPVWQPNQRVRPEGLACYPCVSTPKWQACRDWRCHEIDLERVFAAAAAYL